MLTPAGHGGSKPQRPLVRKGSRGTGSGARHGTRIGRDDDGTPPPKKIARGTAAAGSWLALVAATTLGHAADTLQADIRAKGLGDGAYRLVVQSYDEAGGQSRVARLARWAASSGR